MWHASNYCTIRTNADAQSVHAKLYALRDSGKITTLRVAIGNKSYGFVRFASPMSIKQALSTLNLGNEYIVKCDMDQAYAEWVMSQPNTQGFGSIHYCNLNNIKMDANDHFDVLNDRMKRIWQVLQTNRCDILIVTGYGDLTHDQIRCYFTRKLAFVETQGRFGVASKVNQFDKIGFAKLQKRSHCKCARDEYQPKVVVAMAPADGKIDTITMDTIASGKRFVQNNSDVPPKRQRVILFHENKSLPDSIVNEYKCKHIDISTS